FVANWATGDGTTNFLYRNDGNGNAWIKVRCIGTKSNRSGFGAKVRVTAKIGGSMRTQVREISGGASYASQNAPEAHFGLKDATVVDTIRIEWPSGIAQELHNVPAKQILTVTESAEPAPAVQPSFSGITRLADGR